MVLTYALPKINSMQEKSAIEQSIGVVKGIDEMITNIINAGPGNSRIAELNIKQGYFLVNVSNSSVNFVYDSLKKEYSQSGVVIKNGNLNIITNKNSNGYETKIYEGYGERNISLVTEDGKDLKVFPSSITQRIIFRFNDTTPTFNRIIVSLQ